MKTNDEFLCARCARHQKTCCQLTDIHTTTGDVQRIAAHTGQNDFTEFRPAANEQYANQDDDPIWRDNVFLPDGTRRVLKQRADGDCIFLGSQGCVLPLETRPLICRLYPFDYTATGIKTELASGCPVELLKPGQTVLAELAMKRSDAERWHQQLYAEIQS